eukprot:UN12308
MFENEKKIFEREKKMYTNKNNVIFSMYEKEAQLKQREIDITKLEQQLDDSAQLLNKNFLQENKKYNIKQRFLLKKKINMKKRITIFRKISRNIT